MALHRFEDGLHRLEGDLSRFRIGRTSVTLVLSYVVDWLVIVIIACGGLGFSSVSPKRRPFDVTDPSLSYPLVEEVIPNATLAVLCGILPAMLILVISLFLGLGPERQHDSSRSASLRRKLWEWNAGWMGLGVALALAFIISSGAKEVVGKPRPNFLARCKPDMSKKLEATVGGIGDQIEEGIALYSWKICRETGAALDEGFRSFPSAHASCSFAGLTYLALWACAKLGITIPILSHRTLKPMSGENDDSLPQRSQAAAPPTYLLIVPLIPIGLALYITGTRYSDYWHHGFDVVSGSILGNLTAWIGFRWYHLPINRGGGWAWAPRSSKRAFGKGIGVLSYIDADSALRKEKDLEDGERDRFYPRPPSRENRSTDSDEHYEMSDFRAPREFLAPPEPPPHLGPSSS